MAFNSTRLKQRGTEWQRTSPAIGSKVASWSQSEDQHGRRREGCAKTTGKAIDAATYWERRARLMDRGAEFLHQRGLAEPNRIVPMSILVPILQLGSMEEDNQLQDLWAQLFVNAADAESGVVVEPAFIGILQNLSARDAAILENIYSVSVEHETQALIMYQLPEKVLTERLPVEIDPPVDVQLSLGNLDRLGLIDAAVMLGGGPSTRYAYQTVLGRAFMKACRDR
jgi:hypothetical protein